MIGLGVAVCVCACVRATNFFFLKFSDGLLPSANTDESSVDTVVVSALPDYFPF